MVLYLEDELDGVARRSADTAGSETKVSVRATNNNLDGVSGGGDRGGTRRARVRRIGRGPYVTTEGDSISHERWSGRRGDGGRSIVSGPSGRWGVLRIRFQLCANRKSSVLEICEGVGGTVSATVDRADHTTVRGQRE